MFGLMRAKKCGMSDEEKHFRRLNYCGTCKTIGSLYSRKSRFLLDHDAVFLAELLTALSGDDVSGWQKSYQSFNCLNVPKSEMPPALEFAATTNVILAEFKLADHVSDEGKKRYEYAYKWFSKDFEKAEKLLRSWRFPLEEVKAILRTQETRERAGFSEQSVEIMDVLAEPTARATAVFFREGVKFIGRGELAETAYDIGFAFGRLIYLVDAFEDFDKDFRADQFNAVRAAFNLKEAKMSREAKRKTVSLAHHLEREISAEIRKLPLAENQKTLFVSRLEGNLRRKFRTNLPVIHSAKKTSCAPKAKRTFSHRWQNAKEKAGNLARDFSWQMPLVFLFVFAFALVAPAQTREARSARECFDLSFNLMFLGAIFGSVLAFPKTILMQNPPPGNLGEQAERRRREGWCDSCNCCPDCCGGCDCCGDCDCCSGCDCCGCDC